MVSDSIYLTIPLCPPRFHTSITKTKSISLSSMMVCSVKKEGGDDAGHWFVQYKQVGMCAGNVYCMSVCLGVSE